MLSVLIPMYNFDTRPLVQDILVAGEISNIEIQVVVCDDASPDTTLYDALQSEYEDITSLTLLSNDTNLGRSKTRNKLVQHAIYDTLVFIDGDSRILDTNTFLTQYANHVDPKTVIVGGTKYSKSSPGIKKHLHWKYGRNRESKSALIRNQTPARYFFSNNFCCSRKVLGQIPFDQEISGYGYEDSLWAKQVLGYGLQIKHIDNYVIHIGLNTNDKFLKNASEAVTTIVKLSNSNRSPDVKLEAFYQSQKTSTIGKILLYLASISCRLNEHLLKSGIHLLKLYDFYRLGLRHKLQKKLNSANRTADKQMT